MAEIADLLPHDLPFEEAVKYFKNRLPMTPSQFQKLAGEYRSMAFTVSGYSSIQIIKQFHDALLKAIESGETMEDFRQRINSFLTDRGYDGITPFQADNIFRTNVQTAYQVGHYNSMTDPAVKRLRPYWQYDAVNDRHTRKAHLAMDGKVFPADSPVWDVWYPPNGYRCRCSVQTLSLRQVEARGLKVEDAAPDAVSMDGLHLTHVMPDHKFGTNPAKHQWQPDMSAYPAPLRKAYERREATNK